MTEDTDDELFDWGGSIFRDEHVFEIDFLPETFEHRDTQMQTLKYAFRPAIRGNRPLNTIVRGPPGTGKTTAIKLLFDEIDAQTDIDVACVNCQLNSSRFKIFSKIYEKLVDHATPPEGIQFKQLFTKITNQLVSNKGILLLALDDVNYLFYENEATDTLYSLLRAHEEQEGVKIGVVVISSDLNLDIINSLDDRVKSVFRPEEIYFNRYDTEEIFDILQARCKRGLRDGVINETVLSQVADLTFKHGGDLRMGIDLLRRGGLTAEQQGHGQISESDIESAYEDTKRPHLSRQMKQISDAEKKLLRILAQNATDDATELYEQLQSQTEIGYTRYSNIIDNVAKLGIISEISSDSQTDGTSQQSITLNYDKDIILNTLDSV